MRQAANDQRSHKPLLSVVVRIDQQGDRQTDKKTDLEGESKFEDFAQSHTSPFSDVSFGDGEQDESGRHPNRQIKQPTVPKHDRGSFEKPHADRQGASKTYHVPHWVGEGDERGMRRTAQSSQ